MTCFSAPLLVHMSSSLNNGVAPPDWVRSSKLIQSEHECLAKRIRFLRYVFPPEGYVVSAHLCSGLVWGSLQGRIRRFRFRAVPDLAVDIPSAYSDYCWIAGPLKANPGSSPLVTKVVPFVVASQ